MLFRSLAFGSRTTLLELIALVERQMERPLPVTHVESRRGDVRDSQASHERLRALFPDVQPVPLERGLAETLEWFRTLGR